MMSFLIVTVLFWLAGSCILKLFFFMIQQGGALDVVFGWQRMLNRLFNGNRRQQLLGKALGDCQMCTSFWFMPFWFICYYFFCKVVMHHWVTDSVSGSFYWPKVIGINILWYWLFHAIGAMVGLVGLTKVLIKKK